MPSTPAATMRTSLHGRRFGLGPANELVSDECRITVPGVDAKITIASSQTSPRAVTIQFLNSDGSNLAEAYLFEAYLFADIAGLTGLAATGGSTGLAADAAHGWMQPFTLNNSQKLGFLGMTDITGLWTGTWTDTAHEVCFLGVIMPSERIVFSAALTTA